MGNTLKMDLEGKVVVIGKKHLLPKFHLVEDRLFEVTGGFGASPVTSGSALMGRFLKHGSDRMEGWMVERLATEEEIAPFKAKEEEEEKVLACPKCNGTLFQIGQLTFNQQDFDSKTQDWGHSYNLGLGDTDYMIEAKCKGCDHEWTDLCQADGHRFFVESTFAEKISIKFQKGQKMLIDLDNQVSPV